MTKEAEKALNKMFSHSKEEGAQALLEHLLRQPWLQLEGHEPNDLCKGGDCYECAINSNTNLIVSGLKRELGMEASGEA